MVIGKLLPAFPVSCGTSDGMDSVDKDVGVVQPAASMRKTMQII
jgi:hypothetical protein